MSDLRDGGAPVAPRPLGLRPALHAATGLGALLLGVLPRPAALLAAGLGIVAGWVVFPLTLDRVLRREDEPWFGGLRTYPLAVLGLVVLLPPLEAAAAWGVLAFGDAAAAVVGRRVPSAPILGHPKATVSGSGAYLVVGAAAAWLLAGGAAALGHAVGAPDPGAAPGVARCVLAALAATVSDAVRVPPDDNLPAAASAGVVLALTRGLG